MAELDLVARLRLASDQYVREVKEAVGVTDKLGDELDDVNKSGKRAGKGLDEAGKAAAKAGKSAGLLVAKFLALATAVGGVLAFSFLKAANTAEQYQVRLNALLGSQEEGNRLFREAAQFASKVPFEYEKIMDAATNLSGVMEGGVDEIMEWLPMITDLATVSGLSVEETTSQIVRMYSAGAGAADLFREKGILAMLGFEAGVSVSAEETRKKLIEAFEDPASKFAGASAEMAKTWSGVMSMMSDKWFLFRNNINDEGLFAFFKELAFIVDEELGEALDDSADSARDWAESIIDAFSGILIAGAHFLDFWDTLAGTFNLIQNTINQLQLNGLTNELQGVNAELDAMATKFGADAPRLELLARQAELIAEIAETEADMLQNNEEARRAFERDWSEGMTAAIERARLAARGAKDDLDDLGQTLEEIVVTGKKVGATIDDIAEVTVTAVKTDRDWNEAMQNLLESLEAERRELTQNAIQTERLNELLADGSITTEEFREQMERLGHTFEDTTEMAEQFEKIWDNMIENMQKEFADEIYDVLFVDGIDSFGDFADSVVDLWKKMIAQMIAAWLTSGIIGLLSGAGFAGFSASGLFGGSGSGIGGTATNIATSAALKQAGTLALESSTGQAVLAALGIGGGGLAIGTGTSLGIGTGALGIGTGTSLGIGTGGVAVGTGASSAGAGLAASASAAIPYVAAAVVAYMAYKQFGGGRSAEEIHADEIALGNRAFAGLDFEILGSSGQGSGITNLGFGASGGRLSGVKEELDSLMTFVENLGLAAHFDGEFLHIQGASGAAIDMIVKQWIDGDAALTESNLAWGQSVLARYQELVAAGVDSADAVRQAYADFHDGSSADFDQWLIDTGQTMDEFIAKWTSGTEIMEGTFLGATNAAHGGLVGLSSSIASLYAQANGLNDLGNIAVGTVPGNFSFPSFAVGTPYVQASGPAIIHAEEAVIPRDLNRALRQFYGGSGGNVGGFDDTRMLSELQSINGRLVAVESAVHRNTDVAGLGAQAVSRNVKKYGTSPRNRRGD